MAKKNIHMIRNINIAVSGLYSTLGNNFPHFRNVALWKAVKRGGKKEAENVFLMLNVFSTNFPQTAVDAEPLVS
jgi:hypothetical protein